MYTYLGREPMRKREKTQEMGENPTFSTKALNIHTVSSR